MVMTDSGHPQLELAPEKKSISRRLSRPLPLRSGRICLQCLRPGISGLRQKAGSVGQRFKCRCASTQWRGEPGRECRPGNSTGPLQNDLQLALAVRNLDLIDVIEILNESGINDEEQALTFTKDDPIPKSCCSSLQSD